MNAAGRALALLLLVLPQFSQAGECRADRVDLRGDWGRAGFTVELADTPAARSDGLMHRESLPAFSGMLFVYDYPQRARFWMKNTLIPLDMLFLGSDGTIRHIHENSQPHSETIIDGGSDIVAVLEINGGMAARLRIAVGDVLRHPAFGTEAAWPCD